MCYACSISCHGDHTLVELFSRRNFTCDCGTTRLPSTSSCSLRPDPITNKKGVSSQEPGKENTYNQNFQNRFCGCEQEYNAETEKGTMYQCLGLGSVETGGCGEDWWHPHCLMGFPSDWLEQARLNGEVKMTGEGDDAEMDHPAPPGFPADDDFVSIICYKCVDSNPWIKAYAGSKGFITIQHGQHTKGLKSDADRRDDMRPDLKRKASDEEATDQSEASAKRLKGEDDLPAAVPQSNDAPAPVKHKHDTLGPVSNGVFSLAGRRDFRDEFCHCPKCFPNLIPHPQLQEEEDEYEPSLSDSEVSLVGDRSGTLSVGTASLLDRGEAALNTMDRVRAIEGVMAYNHLKDKVKAFLKPYAESGEAVGAEDIKAYFEKLRGDEAAIKEAGKYSFRVVILSLTTHRHSSRARQGQGR